LFELIMIGCICDGREMKNSIEFFVPESLAPIQADEIFGHEIAAIAGEIFKIARPKIINHSQMRIREFFLQGERKIRADKAGAAGHDEIRKGVQFQKRKWDR